MKPEAREKTARASAIRASWQAAAADAPLADLRLSPRAYRALTRAGAVKVADVARQSLLELETFPNVGAVTLRQLGELIGVLRRRFGNRPTNAEGSRKGSGAGERPDAPDVGELESVLLQCLAGGKPWEAEAVRGLLGRRRNGADLGPWPSQSRVAGALGVSRSELGRATARARRSWWREPPLTALRNRLCEVLAAHGGAMAVAGLAAAVSGEAGRRGVALLRGLVEAEAHCADPRFRAYRRSPGVFVALTGRSRLGARRATCASVLAAGPRR